MTTIGRYNAVPRKGHPVAKMRIFGYLKYYKKRWIICDIIFLEDQGEVYLETNWPYMNPDDVKELPPDILEPNGKPVRINTFVDADHAHDIDIRRSVTGVLILLNKNPTQWYSKR